jgi:antitoxin component YwqK of YwqJK toxin-antitoxin module
MEYSFYEKGSKKLEAKYFENKKFGKEINYYENGNI